MGSRMNEPVLVEICVESVASALAAQRGGAARVELCSDLLEGGVTPSAGLLQTVRTKISIGLQVIIRPRGGDFCYEEDEIEVMKQNIAACKRLGADGIVLGVLDADGNVDIGRTRQLVELARPLNVTFHRAFDMTADLSRALEDVCATGADRILTSGGEQKCSQGLETIAQLVASARGRIKIMACGGIRHDNAARIVAQTGVREIHAGPSSPVPSPMRYRNSRVSLGKAADGEYLRSQVLEEDVQKLCRAVAPGST
jgi:copper homeostasis protein